MANTNAPGSSKSDDAVSSDPLRSGKLQASISDDPTAPMAPPADLPLTSPAWVLSPEVGTQVGVYRLDEKLGEGGMGAVWKAFHGRLKKHVALKTLPPSFLRDANLVARFGREMEAVARVDHPNVVRAMDAGEHQGLHYLVMEYIDGVDLSALVKSRGPLPVREACEWVRQAALGLAAAHKQGLVHRDVKPSNLILAHPTNGEPGIVKVLDLGLARIADDFFGENPVSLTGSGQIVGTPDYMAPEQWDPVSRKEGATADLYALGCTLFYLLVGRAPFGDASHATWLNKMVAHRSEPIPDLLAARRERQTLEARLPSGRLSTTDIPPELNALYRRLMAKNPAERFASAAELAESLSRIIQGASLKSDAPVAEEPTVERELRSPISRRAGLALASFGSLAALAFLVIAFASKQDDKSETRTIAESTANAEGGAETPPPTSTEVPRAEIPVRPVPATVEAVHPLKGENETRTPFQNAIDFRAAHSLSLDELRAWNEGLPPDFRAIEITATANADPPRFNAVAILDETRFEHRAYYGLSDEMVGSLFRQLDTNAWGQMIATPYRENGQSLSVHVWRKQALNWSGRGLRRSDLPKAVESLKRAKMRPIQIHVWPEGTKSEDLGVISRPDQRNDWTVEFDLSAEDLTARIEDAERKGWRPSLLTCYVHLRRIRYGLGTIENPTAGDWAYFHDLTPETLEIVLTEQKRLKRRPLCLVSAIESAGATPRFAGIWVEYRPVAVADKTQ